MNTQELIKCSPITANKISQKPQKPPSKTLSTRERESLLKLIIGMAIAGYSYNPSAKRNDAVADITNDLEKLGIELSDDTIRKYLNEAKELLPQNTL